jgi:hypothetical protein
VLNKQIIEYEDGNTVGYDVLIGVPQPVPPDVIRNSNLIKQGHD